jgi:hypothetical protein
MSDYKFKLKTSNIYKNKERQSFPLPYCEYMFAVYKGDSPIHLNKDGYPPLRLDVMDIRDQSKLSNMDNVLNNILDALPETNVDIDKTQLIKSYKVCQKKLLKKIIIDELKKS